MIIPVIMRRKYRMFSSLWTAPRSAKNIVVSHILAWTAKACLYPYACLLGFVSVLAIFQIINMIDPPFIMKSEHGLIDAAQHPGGPPLKCQWNIHIFARLRGLSKRAEYIGLMSKMKKKAGQKYAAKVTCAGKDNQIPCTLRVTVSSNETDLRNKDAVIFGMSTEDIKGSADRFSSKYRGNLGQLWVFYTMQSPLEMKKAVPDVGRFPMHLMWSYLTASTITTPYAIHLQTGKPMDKGNGTGQYVSGNRKLVAWMGNNCPGNFHWPRGWYLEKLKRSIPVDMYGECTNLTCLPRTSEQCGMLMGQYKFFLAFESSECREYLTDQFWYTALLHQTVPVVYGPKKDSYIKVAPPNSFIHVSDFESPKDLAEYLVMLDKNDGLYSRFLKWRQSGSLITNFQQFKPEMLCKLLPHIEDMKVGRFERKTVAQTKWFNSCRSSGNVTKKSAVKNWVPWS